MIPEGIVGSIGAFFFSQSVDDVPEGLVPRIKLLFSRWDMGDLRNSKLFDSEELKFLKEAKEAKGKGTLAAFLARALQKS